MVRFDFYGFSLDMLLVRADAKLRLQCGSKVFGVRPFNLDRLSIPT